MVVKKILWRSTLFFRCINGASLSSYFLSLGYPFPFFVFFLPLGMNKLQLLSRRIDAKLCERYTFVPYFLKWGSNLIIIDFHHRKVPGNFQAG
jgi:hypothetical protein